VQAATLPEQLQSKCYCPSCGKLLVSARCLDPWAISLVCLGSHRFFVMPETPLAWQTAMAASLPLPHLDSWAPQDVASFWLADPTVRPMLNEQLAQLLRTILEARQVSDNPNFSFCPLCGGPLAEYEQPDIWVRGLRCLNGHSWAERGGCIYCKIDGVLFRLHAEDPDKTTSQLIAAWLKRHPHLDTNLHESVRRVLLSSRFCPADSADR